MSADVLFTIFMICTWRVIQLIPQSQQSETCQQRILRHLCVSMGILLVIHQLISKAGLSPRNIRVCLAYWEDSWLSMTCVQFAWECPLLSYRYHYSKTFLAHCVGFIVAWCQISYPSFCRECVLDVVSALDYLPYFHRNMSGCKSYTNPSSLGDREDIFIIHLIIIKSDVSTFTIIVIFFSWLCPSSGCSISLRLYHYLNYLSFNVWGFIYSAYPFLLMMVMRICVLYLIIVIKSEVWPICHCLWIGLVCPVCLS